jgi:O-antigen ligase
LNSPDIKSDIWLRRLTIALFFCLPLSAALSNALWVLLVIAWILAYRSFALVAQTFRQPVGYACLGLYALIVIGVFLSDAPSADIVQHLRKYAKILLIPIVMDIVGRLGIRRLCENAFALSCAILITITLVMLLNTTGPDRIAALSEKAIFGDYVVQSILMSVFVLLSLLRCIETLRYRPRVAAAWAAGGFAGVFTITQLSIGRTGIVMLGVVSLVLLTYGLRIDRRVRLLAILVVGVGAVLAVSSNAMRDRWSLFFEEVRLADTNRNTSTGHRLYNFQQSIQMITERPLTGWGTGAYHTRVCDFIEQRDQCWIFNWHPHNQYLFFGVGHGIPGIGLYILWLATIASRHRYLSQPTRQALLLGTVAMLAVDSLFNSPLWSGRESLLFILMIALFSASNSAGNRH